MNPYETTKTISVSEFESFLSEMHALKSEEIKNGTVHFENISVDDLNADDMEIYHKLKNGALNTSDFEIYRSSVVRDGNKSRIDFAGYIANMLSSTSLTEQFLAKKDITR